MKKELDELLCSKYPEIFGDRHGNVTKTAMCWGFECGDGWFDLIDTLCACIAGDIKQKERAVEFHQQMLEETDRKDWTPHMHEMWTPENLIAKVEEYHKAKNIRAVQVKEKFGGLRFYVSGGCDKHHAMIDFAENLSYRICEDCGSMKDTITYSIGWIRTLCPEHANKHYGEDAEHFRNKTGEWAQEAQ